MLDPEVYLGKLTLFGRLLRQEGMEVSPRENEDACSILMDLGFADRETVKTALRAVYAKSRDEQLRFDRVFDSFFLPEDVIRALDQKHTEEERRKREAVQQAREELLQQQSSYSEEEIEAYARLSGEEKERLRRSRERYANAPNGSEGLYAGFIHSIFARSILEQQMKMEDAAVGAGTLDPEVGLLFRDISEFQDREIPRAVSYIRDIASRINGELTREKKKSGRNGTLDFRRTIRRGLETGGSLYRLAYRKRKKKRRQLVVLCDVSASMIRFSEFALRFILALSETADRTRVILFSETSAEADPFHLQNMDRFRDYVRRTGVFGKGTDLGRAVRRLCDERPPVLTSAVTLLILSDAKTIDTAGSCEQLRRAVSMAGKVILLNPIPQRKWKYSKAIRAAAECCTMVSCSTLSELGEACRRLALQ